MPSFSKEVIEDIALKSRISVEQVEQILDKRFTAEELRKMNLVTQLRLVGRVKGVKSPTSKKMNVLIEEIIAIQDGRLAPDYSRKGRGVKGVQEERAANSSGKNDDNRIQDDLNQFCIPNILKVSEPSSSPKKPSEHKNHPDTTNIANVDGTAPKTENDESELGNAEVAVGETAKATFDKSDDITVEGVLDLMQEGYGFLRTFNYYASKNDVYVGAQTIKKFNLRQGDKLTCVARYFDKTKSPSLIYIHTINDMPCDHVGRRPYFNDFEAAYPKERIKLETGADRMDFSLRAIDLVAPIGKGQRGLIAAPPKTGKTTLLKKIAQSVSKTYGDSIKVFVLLIDERPEEVTDFKDSVPNAEVVFSTFDQLPDHHTSVAEMMLQNCKHRVEQGQDVLLLLDSITRLARAYNKTAEATGRTLTGGLDIAALETPKAFFGSARRVVSGGSLTILATALVETGSRMDDIIYEEFKGTGNMEIHLDRALSDRRIFPAIDLVKSSTRHEEMLLSQNELEGMWLIRRKLSRSDNVEACMQLMDLLTCTANNEEFIKTLKVLK